MLQTINFPCMSTVFQRSGQEYPNSRQIVSCLSSKHGANVVGPQRRFPLEHITLKKIPSYLWHVQFNDSQKLQIL